MFVPFVLRKIRKSEAFLEVFFIGSRIGIIDFLPLSDSLCNTSLFLITKKLHGCILKPVGAYLAQSIRNCISPSDTTSSLYSRTHRLVSIISIMSFKITHTYSNRQDLSYSFLNLNFFDSNFMYSAELLLLSMRVCLDARFARLLQNESIVFHLHQKLFCEYLSESYVRSACRIRRKRNPVNPKPTPKPASKK